MEEIPCIFGHGYSDRVVIQENGFQGRRCAVCGTIFISPRPEPGEVFDIYAHDKAYLPSSKHVAPSPLADFAARHHLRIIRRLKRPPATLAEIGCGGGHFLRAAREMGYDVCGVELNPYQSEHVRSNLGIPCESKPFSLESFGREKRFDIIYHVDVTSHLPDPIADFRAMRKKLNPGGVLVFETGNGADIAERYYGIFPAWQYPDHLFFFGRQSLDLLLKAAGFPDGGAAVRAYNILPQMRLLKMLSKRRKHQAAGPGQPEPPAVGSKPPAPSRAARAKAWVIHFLRYGLGRLRVDPEAPLTLLISVRKE